jgi:hypothetical protein
VHSEGKPLSRSHRRRKANRESLILEHGYRPTNSTLNQHIVPAKPLRTAARLTGIRVKRGAYAALNTPAPDEPTKVEAIERLMKEEGYSYVAWDGLYVVISLLYL